MTEEKLCPIMSRPHITYATTDGMMMTAVNGEVLCRKEGCMAWVPIQKVEWRCTKDIRETEDPCPMDIVVEPPENQTLFCDGCKYWKMFEIKPVPAHCKIIERGERL